MMLDLSVEVVDGRPLFAITKFNGVPLPIVGGIIARGANRGLDQALDAAGASVTAIEISGSGIRLAMEGSGTQTAAVEGGRCRDGFAFADDFADIFSGWAQHYDTEEAEVGYWQGGYLLQTRASGIIINQALPCRFTDFDASVEASTVGDPGDAAWGLIFLEVDPDNYWVFQINALGWYSVERLQDGVLSLVVPWTQSSSILTAETNTLAVGLRSGNGEVAANGQRLAAFVVTSPSPSAAPGSFGLQLRSASQAEVGVLFDNLSISVP
jgi:hypothetical protein